MACRWLLNAFLTGDARRLFFPLSFIFFTCICQVQQGEAQDGERTKLTYTIVEEMQAGTPVGIVPDDARLSNKHPVQVMNQLRYGFLRQTGTHADYFTIDEESGMLSTKAPVDREGLCPGAPRTCDVAFDVAVSPRPVSFLEVISVVVHVLDLNDHAPRFSRTQVSIPISESVMPGATYILPTALDPDSGVFAVRSYSLVPESNDFGLVITNTSGTPEDVRLALRHRLDREIQTDYTVRLIAYDGGTPPKSGSILVKVTVQDANDNSPRFENNTYNIRVREDAPPGTPIVALHASDPDEGPSGQVVYSLAIDGRPSPISPFQINAKTGQIVVTKPLDYETNPVYNLLVTARDKGPDSVPTHARVTINVLDVNDHAPTVNVNPLTSDGIPEVLEHIDEGQFVAHMSVVDEDGGDSGDAECILDNEYFYMEPIYRNEYKLITSGPIDRERDPVVTLTIHCSDKGNPPMTSTQKVNITILDINDNTPVFSKISYSITMKENNTIGSHILTVNATDADTGPNARVTYRLGSNARGLVRIEPGTGVIRTDGVFDFETQKYLQFTVTAIDGGSPPNSASATVVVNILDVNDEAPVFKLKNYNFVNFENQPPGTEIGNVSAKDGDSPPYDAFYFEIQASGAIKDLFTINKDTGKITTTYVLDREYLSNYSFLVLAINPGFPSLTSTANVTVQVADVNDNAPMFIFPTNDNFTISAPLSGPKGYVICRAAAKDADFGTNSKIEYSIAKGNTEGDLQIDPNSGNISLNVDKLNPAGYKFKIMAKDRGSPAKSAVTDLVVNVNASLVVAGLGSRKSDATGSGATHNQLIVITLGAATLVLVAILLAAIVCIQKKQHRVKRDTYKYVCQVGAAAQNSPTHRPIDAICLEQNGSPRHIGHMENGGHNLPQLERSPKKATPGSRRYLDGPMPLSSGAGKMQSVSSVEVNTNPPAGIATDPQQVTEQYHRTVDLLESPDSFRLPYKYPTTHPRPHKTLANLTQSSLGMNTDGICTGTMLPNGSEGHMDRTRDRPQATPHPRQARELKPWLLTERELEMHRRLHLFIREPVGYNDSDSTSGCSADMSNADSGRGPSEDGEYSRNGEPQRERNQKCLSQVSKDSGHCSMSQEITDPPAPATIVGVSLGSTAAGGTTHTSTLPSHHHHHGPPSSGADKFPCKCFTMNRSGLQWVKRGQGFGSHSRRAMPGNIQEACDCLSASSAAAASNPAFQSDKSISNLTPGDTRTLPASHPDYLTQRKLLESDRRYRRSRSQRIAPEHSDGTYVNTFGHTIPLKTLGRLEENGDEFSDDCSTTTSGSYDVGQFIVSSPLPQTATIRLEPGGKTLKKDSTI